ncbi:MAG TPA: DUF3240 family protein [Methylococcaceae bacterium]|nr:DUF3240 family protein [Methylococcaceae bacterium]
MNQRYLITLTVSPAIEESVVDWLLQFAAKGGFTSFPVNGHSSRQEGLTPAEQVAGRKKQIRFQMHVPEAELTPILERMKQDFQGAGLHYWVSPILEAGHI